MIKKYGIFLLGAAMAATMIAEPANALYYFTYYYADGSYAGVRAYCDNGQEIGHDGTSTPYFTYTQVFDSYC